MHDEIVYQISFQLTLTDKICISLSNVDKIRCYLIAKSKDNIINSIKMTLCQSQFEFVIATKYWKRHLLQIEIRMI